MKKTVTFGERVDEELVAKEGNDQSQKIGEKDYKETWEEEMKHNKFCKPFLTYSQRRKPHHEIKKQANIEFLPCQEFNMNF